MKEKWQNKIIKVVGLVLGVGMVISLGRGLWQLYWARERVDQAREDFLEIKEENLKLQKRLGEVQSEEFVEEQARNKLNMKLPEEKILIVPDDLKLEIRGREEELEVEKPNWQKWWGLFK